MDIINNAILFAFDHAMQINSGSLEYVSGSVTVSAECLPSWEYGKTVKMDDNNFKTNYENFSVMVRTTDIENWGLEPLQSDVTLNGVIYTLANMVLKTPVLWTLTLTKKP